MTKEFKEKLKSNPNNLFYNSTGSTVAYKLCIRHLSAAMSAGCATLQNGYMYPKDVLYVVDIDNECIDEVTDRIKLIKLEVLK